MTIFCKNYGDPDVPQCVREPDERYTMRFDDIGEPPIHWCAVCGPPMHEIDRKIQRAFRERGQPFAEAFGSAIEKALAEKKRQAS